MIGNPLEITDTVEHDGNAVAVMNGKILLVQFYKIGSKFILITVYLFLCFFHQSLSFCAEILQKVQGGKQSSVRILCHFFRCIPALLNCKCRFLQKTAFQDHEIRICCHLLLLFLPVADSKTGKLLQSLSKRKKNKSCRDIEGTVQDRDPGRSRCLCHK